MANNKPYKFSHLARIGKKAHNSKDLSGTVFGMLTVISGAPQTTIDKHGYRQTKMIWLCRCGCGGNRTVDTSGLIRKQSPVRHCGCVPLPSNAKADGAITKRFSMYKVSAKRNSRDFNLYLEQFKALITSNCHYCGEQPGGLEKYCAIPQLVNGVDRIDSCLGYSVDNCVSCCEQCNRAKLDYSYAEFIAWVHRVHTHQILHGRNPYAKSA